jgi:pyrroline-5-carboxylate reductase
MADSSAPAFAFIGCGNMGGAILRGALTNGVLQAERTLVVDESAEARTRSQALGVRSSARVAEAAGAPRVLLAVKPQSFEGVAKEFGASGARNPLVISVMAGWSALSIERALGGARVVRAMPNLPAQIGLGITAIAPGANVADDDAHFVDSLFAGVGKTIRVREDQLDAVTAVSGSGPAYFFLLAEAKARAAVELGFDDAMARALVAHTLLGAATLLANGTHSAGDLRAAVTSKGGTTEAALRVFQERGFEEIVSAAMAAARDRGRELGR